MKIFDGMQSFFGSIGEYVKNFSNLFLIFLGAFLLVSVIVIFITSFSYECMLTKTIDKINKFLERNPRINDDNLVAFNNLMKARSVPKTLRRQWQQFMLYREHPASYYMSFQHCVENPLRNGAFRQEMTVYRIISYILIALSALASTFMATQSHYANITLRDMFIIPLTILVLYWLISMVLDLIHNAISSDLFQNYQYFEINMDKAMLTLPEFVDYEVLFSQDEIRNGIPVLFAYLQKRAIQEQQELEKARLKNVEHEKFDFDEAGLDASLVLDRAMRETENFSTQRKKYLQEIERVNNEILALENNYREQVKDYQRQVQTSKETVENLKQQLEQANSTIEINYIKKQMRDELSRQQVAEKDFDILTDKHNQEVKTANQEIKHYEDEIKKAKEALEVAMLSEFNTYSVKVYDNLEKIVDEKMQDKVDDYKDQIKGLEVQIEEKNEELENVYTRYQEVISQVPSEVPVISEEYVDVPETGKKGKKKKKGADAYEAVEPADNYNSNEYAPAENQYNEYASYDNQEYAEGQDNAQYQQYDEGYGVEDNQNYAPVDDENAQTDDSYYGNENEYNQYGDNYSTEGNDYVPLDNSQNGEYSQDYVPVNDEQYDDTYNNEYSENAEYVPLDDNYSQSTGDYVPLDNEYVPQDEQYNQEYSTDDNQYGEYVPLDEGYDYQQGETEYTPLDEESNNSNTYQEDEEDETPVSTEETIEELDNNFDDVDFDINFSDKSNKNSSASEDMDFDSIFGGSEEDEDETPEEEPKEVEPQDIDDDFDIDSLLNVYDDKETEQPSREKVEEVSKPVVDENVDEEDEETEDEEDDGLFGEEEDLEEESEDELPAPTVKRKAGRPRKIVDESEIKPKRSVGRPRKVVANEELETPKRRVGRPRKMVDENNYNEPKRGRGRPRKEDSDYTVTKRGPGRPAGKRGLGRPAGKRGRPRKDINVKRSVGRPRKYENGDVLSAPKRSVGRPRKDNNVSTAKRGRGRPRKS